MADPIRTAALAERIGTLVERSSRLWAGSLDRSVESAGKRLKPDPLNAVPAMSKVVNDYMEHPQKVFDASARYWAEQIDLWSRMIQSMTGDKVDPAISPEKSDKRFKDADWSENPYFDYLKQAYLLNARFLRDELDHAEGLNPQERKKLNLLARNFIQAMSPTNFPATNPAVIRTTIEEEGENLARGLENLVRDMDRGHGNLLIRQTDMDAFEVGRNMAVTPGKVIFENRLFQLIQYTPTTDEVHETPLLICPPWINKFYILDLNEKKSMIRWLVEHGHTVFVLSWVNPNDDHRDETWETYMKDGILTALDKVLEETGQPQTNIVGYCIGATLLATVMAWMAKKGDDRIKSATFFTGQLDFSDAGELQAFVDDEVLDTVSQAAEEHGYLAAENMFGAFNSLRANDLIWSFVVNNYLMGRDNFPFDLLYWNSDSTCMPGRVHTFYLDTFYNKDLLAKGELSLLGETLDMKDVKSPCYHVAAVEDHIAPAASAYRAAKLVGSTKQKFVLSGSGHIAGVVNPPVLGKYQYWTRSGIKQADVESWREGTKETAGSWWPDWDKWLAKHSSAKVPAREPGKTLGMTEDAPGRYVKDRSDAR
ncbi:MAG: class I poly(R)-hydroxyalkanoic acid synthase [Pseudomonadota bacterium]